MRKRMILAVIVSLVAVLAMAALAGCGGGDKQAAIDAFKEASATYTEDVQDMDFDATLTAKVDMSGTDLLSIDGEMKAQYKLPDGVTIKADDAKQLIDSLDKIDLLFELSAAMNAMGEASDLAVDFYVTDNKMYMHMASPDSEEVKSFVEITPEIKQQILDSLDEALSELDSSSSEDLAKLKDEFPIEKYVTAGSVNGDKVTLTIDLFKVLDDLVAKSATEDGGDITEALNSIQAFKDACSNGDIIVEATINEDKHFTSFKVSMDMDLDFGAVMGGESSASSKAHVTFVFDCPTYEVNTGKDVEFPSFDGYEDATEEMAKDLEGAVEADKAEAAA